jgi:hypothetical protein
LGHKERALGQPDDVLQKRFDTGNKAWADPQLRSRHATLRKTVSALD